MLHVKHPPISTEEASYRKHINVLDTNMAYVDVGEGDPIVFLNGRWDAVLSLAGNIIPYLLPYGRCLAPDYVGMGNSGAALNGSYRFVDHQRYLDAWFDALRLNRQSTTRSYTTGDRRSASIGPIITPTASRRSFTWKVSCVRSAPGMNGLTRRVTFFQAQRTDKGEDLILQKNLFIEYLLPLRHISEDAMEVYRRHFRNPGPSRMPMLTWTRELPIAGEPADVVAIVEAYAKWLSTSRISKLFIDADPAGFSDRRAARILPGVAEPANGAGQGLALPPGGSARRSRRSHRAVCLTGSGGTDQLGVAA